MGKRKSKIQNTEDRFIKRWRVSDYVPKGRDSRRGFEAAFLEAVSRLVPELVSSLRGDVLPVFTALEALANRASDPAVAASLRRQFEIDGEPPPLLGVLDGSNVRVSERPYRLKINWASLRHADEATRFYPDFVPLRVAVEKWATKFNMAGHVFFLDAALNTLKQWSLHPEFGGGGLALRGYARFSPVSDDESRFVFENAGWDPADERFDSFAARLRPQFDSALVAYRARLEALTEERGYEKVPELHRTEHIEWLALFQCGGHSITTIQKRWAQDPTTISKGISSAARLVGIALRTKGRGRPPKLKS